MGLRSLYIRAGEDSVSGNTSDFELGRLRATMPSRRAEAIWISADRLAYVQSV